MHALAARGLAARRRDDATRRSPPTSSSPTSELRPGRPRRCATSAASCKAETADRRPGACSTSVDEQRRPRRGRTRWCGPAPSSTCPAPLGEQLEATGGTELLRDIELPLVEHARRDGAHRHRRRHRRARARSRPTSTPRCARPSRTPATPSAASRSTSARPSSCRPCSSRRSACPRRERTKTGYTTDADALTDLYAKTEHPFLEALLRHRDAVAAAGHRRGAASSRSPRTAHPHDLHPDDRGDGPAQLHRPEPAERPDPHRGGPPHPRGVHRRRRASSR